MARLGSLLVLAATILGGLALTYYAIEPEPVLTVNCDGETQLYIVPPEGLTLEYNWTHSVEGTIIVEVYNVTPEGLTLIKAMSQSFGAGHPYSAREIGGSFRVTGKYMVYTANYPIGRTLEIEGPREYANYIEVSNYGKACIHFQHAVIEVKWEPRLIAMLKSSR
jgi:hypothetical protein